MRPENHNEQPRNELGKRLAALRREAIFVPPEVDGAVLAAARDHFRQAAKTRRGWLQPWQAAAAALLLGAGVVIQVATHREVLREDVDGNGKVNVLDAMVLARQVQHGVITLEFDLNNDGVVDGLDVDAVAYRAVRLGEGPKS